MKNLNDAEVISAFHLADSASEAERKRLLKGARRLLALVDAPRPMPGDRDVWSTSPVAENMSDRLSDKTIFHNAHLWLNQPLAQEVYAFTKGVRFAERFYVDAYIASRQSKARNSSETKPDDAGHTPFLPEKFSQVSIKYLGQGDCNESHSEDRNAAAPASAHERGLIQLT